MTIERMLSYVVSAIAAAPKDTKTEDLQKFCSAHKVSKDDVKGMIARGCTDEGAIRAARGDLTHKAPAKKKAPKKKA